MRLKVYLATLMDICKAISRGGREFYSYATICQARMDEGRGFEKTSSELFLFYLICSRGFQVRSRTRPMNFGSFKGTLSNRFSRSIKADFAPKVLEDKLPESYSLGDFEAGRSAKMPSRPQSVLKA